MKWITATELKQWADTRDCQETLPELIKKLIIASTSSIEKLRMPSGDAVHLSGWDGILICEETIFLNISGISLWEIGTNQDTKSKIEKDYAKRKQEPSNYLPSSSIFVFVTPRIWEGAEAWVNEKKTENYWKDVVVITAVELENWLLSCPAVGLWLAERLGRTSPNGVYTINSFWEKWSIGKDNIILQPSILLGGREKESQAIIEQMQSPNIGIVQSMSQEESLAFIVASILENSNNITILPKCIIIENEDTLKQIIDNYQNLIIIAKVENRNHTYAISKGHTILYVAGLDEVFQSSNVTSLPQIERNKFIEALNKSGFPYDFANQLSRETVRNITILRRKLEFDFNAPLWSKAENIREIIPAILVGRWNEKMEGDKEIVSLLAGEPYEDYQKKLQKWLNSDDSPLICIEGTWRTTSAYEALTFAANYLTPTDFDKYKEAFDIITKDIDPDALEKRKPTSFQFWQFKQNYSNWQKGGFFQNAILISLLSENQSFIKLANKVSWIDNLIHNLLKNSTLEWWLSYRHIISEIAEASPKKFTEFIIEDLKKETSIIKELFLVDKEIDLMFSRVDYVDVLFALERLAWDKEFLLPVSLILIELAQVKNESNMANKPMNSLENIYKVWHPQTFANINERNQALNTMVQKFPLQGFDLCVKLTNRWDHGTAFYTQKMRWRFFGQSRDNQLPYSEMVTAIENAVQLLINSCNKTSEQICMLIDISSHKSIGSENRDKILNYIKSNIQDFFGDVAITDQLRHEIYHHKSYPNTEWALPKSEISKYEKLMKLVEPIEINRKYLWMFKDSYLETLEIDKHDDHQKRWEKKIELRSNALKKIFGNGGIKAIFEFANAVKSPKDVGIGYAHICEDDDLEKIFIAAKDEKIPLEFSENFFRVYAQLKGIEIFISKIKELEVNYREYIHQPLSALYVLKEIWQYIETFPQSIQEQYWRSASIAWLYEDTDTNIYLITKLNHVSRFADSLLIIYHSLEKNLIQPDIVIETIKLFIKNPLQVPRNLSHELVEIILYLDKNENVKTKDVIQFEILFYKLLKRYHQHYNIRLNKELLTDPETMMELISLVYMPSDENERIKFQEKFKDNQHMEHFVKLGLDILWDFEGIPFVDEQYNISEEKLNNYIDRLRELAIENFRTEHVDHVIGEMLGNYPYIENYPPEPICKIIERLNNTFVNEGFRTRLVNKRGVTVRPAFSGGTLEMVESEKYKKYADNVRFLYPIIANIFDELSQRYKNMAVEEDNSTKMEAMEY